jgi:hypothetical protein
MTPDAGRNRSLTWAVVIAGGVAMAAAGMALVSAAGSGGRGALSVVAAFVAGAAVAPLVRRARRAPQVRDTVERRRTRARRQRPAEARRDCRQSLASVRSMGRVAEQVAGGDSASFVVLDVARALIELLDLDDCRFEHAAGGVTGRPVLLHGGEFTYRGVRWSPVHIGLPEKGFDLPMVARGQVVGRFVCLPGRRRPIPEDRVLAALALVDQAATAQLIEHVA